MSPDRESMLESLALLQRARRALLRKRPFFGTLAMSLRLRIDPRHPTCYTDALVLGFNPEFLAAISFEDAQACIAHEVLHCALKHFARLKGRNFDAWQESTDHVVNLMLKQEGLSIPSTVGGKTFNHSCDPTFAGMSAEDIYPMVLHKYAAEEEEQQPDDDQHEGDSDEEGDEDSSDPGESGTQSKKGAKVGKGAASSSLPASSAVGDVLAPGSASGSFEGVEEESEGAHPKPAEDGARSGDQRDDLDSADPASEEQQGAGAEEQEQIEPTVAPLSEAEERALEEQWGERAAAAAIQAMSRGQGSASLKRAVDESVAASAPFRDYLRSFLLRAMRKENEDWCRPSRRSQASGAYLPRARSEGIGTLIVAVDTSGSIGNKELSRFVAEMQRAKEELRPARVVVMFADDHIDEERTFEEYESLEAAREMARGYGGTDFRPVFARALQMSEEGEQVDGIIYLTDMDGAFPERFDDLPPTLWVDDGSYDSRIRRAPFGERISLTA